MKKFLKLFIICLVGFALVSCDSENEDQKNDGPNNEVKTPLDEPTPVEKIESVIYRLEYADTYSEDVAFVFSDDTKTWTADITDLTGVIGVEIYANNKPLSLQGLVLSGVGSDSSALVYKGGEGESTLLIGNKVLDDLSIKFNPDKETFKVTAHELIVIDEVEVTYEVYAGPNLVNSGTAVLGDGGNYYFDIVLGEFSRVDVYCNGQKVSASNTEVSGAFKNQVQATWTKDFYLDELDETRFVYFLETENTYTFVYTAATSTSGAKMEIQWHEPEISDEGLFVKNVQHATFDVEEANGVYTITFTGSAAYSGIQIFYEGTEIQQSNVTASGEGYFADWGTLNNTSSKLGLYYQPDDGQSAPGWFSINPGTLVLVYNSADNTLVISYE